MNNFDCSSSGVSVEVSIFYDTYMSGENWESNISGIKGVPHTYLYNPYGQLNIDSLDILDLADDIPVKILDSMLLEHEILDDSNLIENMTHDDKYDEVCNWYHDNDYVSNTERLEILQNNPLIAKYDFEVEITRGYNQGDVARVIIPVKDLIELWGSYDREENLKSINNLFWDAPLSCRVSVNDEEMYVDEYDGYYIDYSYRDVFTKTIVDDIVSQVEKWENKIDLEILKNELESLIPDISDIEYI